MSFGDPASGLEFTVEGSGLVQDLEFRRTKVQGFV